MALISSRPQPAPLTPSEQVLKFLVDIGLDPLDQDNVLEVHINLMHKVVKVAILDPSVPQLSIGGGLVQVGIKQKELFL